MLAVSRTRRISSLAYATEDNASDENTGSARILGSSVCSSLPAGHGATHQDPLRDTAVRGGRLRPSRPMLPRGLTSARCPRPPSGSPTPGSVTIISGACASSPSFLRSARTYVRRYVVSVPYPWPQTLRRSHWWVRSLPGFATKASRSPYSVGVRWTCSPVAGDEASREVDLERAEGEDGRDGLLGSLAPHRSAGPCEQLLHAEGLRDVVVGARRPAPPPCRAVPRAPTAR